MLYGIILTILIGLFFLIGIIFFEKVKNKEKMSLFTTSLAFIVLIGLLFLDLLPELIEEFNIYTLLFAILGFVLLIILDKLIPHHHHEHHDINDDKKDHNLHLQHIGMITIISLAIHNMIEGLTLYSITLNDLKSGILMMISIALHNIPLGFQIGSSLSKKKSNILLVILLCSSSLIGALIIIIFGNLSSMLTSIFLSLTFGMLLYILIFELFNEIKDYLRKKEVIYGIIIGMVILIITYLV